VIIKEQGTVIVLSSDENIPEEYYLIKKIIYALAGLHSCMQEEPIKILNR
jgi:hypothetical protein